MENQKKINPIGFQRSSAPGSDQPGSSPANQYLTDITPVKNQNYIVRGKAKEIKSESGLTKFKLVIYWEVDKFGTPFTTLQKQRMEHRKFIDSIDFYLLGGEYFTNHLQALDTLKNYVEKYRSRMIKALIIHNNFLNECEEIIGSFGRDPGRDQWIQPLFKQTDKGLFFDSLMAPPLRIDEMRSYLLTKKRLSDGQK